MGETIEIKTNAEPDPPNALADPGSVENALLNLALDARDAMPDGGTPTIQCGNTALGEDDIAANPEAVTGEYISLAVTDRDGHPGQGVGACVRTVLHCQGSGLVLSMVSGFAKQSGGHVTVHSEVGTGTMVKINLPSSEESGDQHAASTTAERPRGNGEAILVIEDDEHVRELVVRVLTQLNYQVIAVSEAAGAREALKSGTAVDLILSDITLPGGVSGPRFAKEARDMHPNIKIIFMSGYSASAGRDDQSLQADGPLINKPFARDDLAIALRDALA